MAVSRARVLAEVFQILTPTAGEAKSQAESSGWRAAEPSQARGNGQSRPIALADDVPTSDASTMWLAEMPKRSSSSSGLPLRGISRTAIRWTRDAGVGHGLRDGVADAAGRVVILDGDDAARRSPSPAAISAVAIDRAPPNTDRSRGSHVPVGLQLVVAPSAPRTPSRRRRRPSRRRRALSRSTFSPPIVNVSSFA